MDDEEVRLLQRCQAGEEPAREELCRIYWPVAMRMARRIAGVSTEAEDLVQESFCRLLGHLQGLRGEASISTWLYRTLANLHQDRLRRLAKRREDPWDEAGARIHPAAADPAEVIEGRLWRRRLARAAKNLSRKDRKLLWWRFRREYSHSQIARKLGCTVDAVKCRLYRITRYLRQELSFEA